LSFWVMDASGISAQVLVRLSDGLLVVGKHPGKLALLQALGIRPACCLIRPRPVSGHRGGLHGIADRAACGAADRPAPRHDRPQTTVAGDQTMAWRRS
jgi:hypothetical protein